VRPENVLIVNITIERGINKNFLRTVVCRPFVIFHIKAYASKHLVP